MNWIDIHCHLDKLETSVEDTLALAKAHHVERVITIGTDPQDLPVVLNLSRKYAGRVFCTLGIHPHEGVLYTAEVGKFIEDHLHESGVVGVGEIGLDYYYNHSTKDHQITAFREQLSIAAKHHMPVEIHTRDAEEDTVQILGEYKDQVKGVIHCFTGTRWLAEQCLNLGYNISISGIVTFKNAEALRDVVRFVPLDRLHIETDSPFLAPVPHRGKKNTPAYVSHVAQFVAELKGVELQDLAQITKDNAEKMFPKLKGSSPAGPAA